MIHACMIDGFGWFRESDYRRAWLSFIEVDYVFPEVLPPGLAFPANLTANRSFRATRWMPTLPEIEALADLSRQDCDTPELASTLARATPYEALYAHRIANADLSQLVLADTSCDPQFALAYLANKLILYGVRNSQVPIAGRDYATSFMLKKLSNLAPPQSPDMILPDQYPSVAYLASALSMPFVADDTLAALSVERLVEFKQRNVHLLALHQLYLLDSAAAFAAIPLDRDFAANVAKFQREAEKRRLEIQSEVRDAWLSAGAEVIKKSILTAGAVTTGVAALRAGSLSDIVSGLIPGLIAGAGVATAAAADAAMKVRKLRRNNLAYLMELPKLRA